MNSFSPLKLKLYIYKQLLLILVFYFCTNVAGHTQSLYLNPCETDSLKVLNGQVEIFLKKGAYRKSKSENVKSQYTSLCSGEILASDGFDFGENASLYFFQTDVDFPVNEDFGIAIWELIQPIVAKIPNGVWVESGWKYLSGRRNLYFVRISTEKRNYQFGFFNIEKKLSFSLLQSETTHSDSDASTEAIGNNMQLTRQEPHRPRYSARR